MTRTSPRPMTRTPPRLLPHEPAVVTHLPARRSDVDWNIWAALRPLRRGPAMLTRMSDFFDYVRHPHVNQRKVAGPPKVADAAIALHGPGPVSYTHLTLPTNREAEKR